MPCLLAEQSEKSQQSHIVSLEVQLMWLRNYIYIIYTQKVQLSQDHYWAQHCSPGAVYHTGTKQMIKESLPTWKETQVWKFGRIGNRSVPGVEALPQWITYGSWTRTKTNDMLKRGSCDEDLWTQSENVEGFDKNWSVVFGVSLNKKCGVIPCFMEMCQDLCFRPFRAMLENA